MNNIANSVFRSGDTIVSTENDAKGKVGAIVYSNETHQLCAIICKHLLPGRLSLGNKRVINLEAEQCLSAPTHYEKTRPDELYGPVSLALTAYSIPDKLRVDSGWSNMAVIPADQIEIQDILTLKRPDAESYRGTISAFHAPFRLIIKDKQPRCFRGAIEVRLLSSAVPQEIRTLSGSAVWAPGGLLAGFMVAANETTLLIAPAEDVLADWNLRPATKEEIEAHNRAVSSAQPGEITPSQVGVSDRIKAHILASPVAHASVVAAA